MNFKDFADKINLDGAACRIYYDIDMPDSFYNELKSLFYNDTTRFFQKISDLYGDAYPELLAVYLRLALDLYQVYQQKAIPEHVYFDTMSDFVLWSRQCYRETGIWGIKEKYWLAEHLKMKLFKLGRLQFQPVEYQSDAFSYPVYTGGQPLPEKTIVYNVHIPAGESLRTSLCEASYQSAQRFFGGTIIFFCESWLLSPRLKEILKPQSNILRFAARYRLIDFDENNDSIHKYLRRNASSLAETVMKYEADYRKIGTAVGYFIYNQ